MWPAKLHAGLLLTINEMDITPTRIHLFYGIRCGPSHSQEHQLRNLREWEEDLDATMIDQRGPSRRQPCADGVAQKGDCIAEAFDLLTCHDTP
uniref:Uncharacterized protein n=1 Tax=Sphaerodactylus townsendi TaxID=933632 RepID=A0ACB8FC76_9SAUR